MGVEAASTTPVAVRDHAFHSVRVARIVRETADASSFVLDVPAELEAAFAYEAGQFCTFRFSIDGATHLRCYSMSSAPAVDDELQVTVKRVPGGLVSNWMLDHIDDGDAVEVTCPAGVFVPAGDGELVAFGGGSGITPLLSLAKRVLATTTRRVRLLYANRDPESVIFAGALDDLVAEHPDRLQVEHRFDVEQGFVDDEAVAAFVAGVASDAEHYICGPTPFMDIVEAALLARGVDAERIHIERFTPAGPPVPSEPDERPTSTAPARLTITCNGRTESGDHHPGTTLLQSARSLGLAPPSSCESGSCATCMAMLLEGTVAMRTNNALTDDEVAEGWVLTCQSVPTAPSVKVVYE